MSFDTWIQDYLLLANIIFVVMLVSASRELYLNRKDKLMLVFLAFGLLYPFGWAMKVYHLGPPILRGYVADIGFVPFFTMMGLLQWYGRDRRRGWDSAVRMTFIGFVLAMNVELFQLFFINPVATRQKVSVPVRGDWMDVAIFMITTGITFYLLYRLRMRDNPSPESRKAPLLPRAERRRSRSKDERRKARRPK